VTLIVREAGLQMRKNPALLTDRGEVVLSLAGEPQADQMQQVSEQIAEATGYQFVVKT